MHLPEIQHTPINPAMIHLRGRHEKEFVIFILNRAGMMLLPIGEK
ncbi:MAG: hypothetical protein SGI98_04015 [Verrucomicrobiota bacterium]|nr:hypothetical protein [Verrucomicrobiota bacterium]